MLSPEGGGVLVVIVALARLVVLGGGAGFSRRTTAEMHPMTLASSGTPSTQPVALALLAALLGMYAEGTTDCGFSADHRRNAPRGLNRRRECAGYSRMRGALILPL